MRALLFLSLFLIIGFPCWCQHYIRGAVKDEQGKNISGVRITLHSTDAIFISGSEGDFGLNSPHLSDTLSFSLEGYQSETLAVRSSDWVQVILKAKPTLVHARKNHLTSMVNLKKADYFSTEPNGESYSSLVENPIVSTTQSPVASFSPNTNKASYSNIRRFLRMGSTVPPDAVRMEELLNYFNFHYQEPTNEKTFHLSSYLTSCPWNRKNALLYLNISARKLDFSNLPPTNLIMIIDISGSMDMPNKLPLIKSGLRLLANNLRAQDTLSLIAYGEQVSLLLDGISGAEKEKILKAVESLEPSGSTPGEAAIKLAYKVAKRWFNPQGTNRIILATDGDFNVGAYEENDLETLIDNYKHSGIYLSCLGVGMGNYKDSKLSLLAQKGHGSFSYIDNEGEAEKVFVQELTQNLYTVADSLLIHVAFDSVHLRSYRLIGFENKRKALKDTTSILEGGEMASGQSLMALFEVQLAEETSISALPVQITLSFQKTDHKAYLQSYDCIHHLIPFVQADTFYKQAACVALFGQKLRSSPYISSASWKKLLTLSRTCFTQDNPMGKEFLELLDKAFRIYVVQKRFWFHR